jgi:carbonic anhydrase/acetyltransferase-like protein (isoleucine patch superfamily)
MATGTTSVPLVEGRHPDAAALDGHVAALRALCPRAVIERYQALVPTLGARVLLAPGAAIVGDVRLGDDVSVWFGAVLRGDLAAVTVGRGSNVQDGSVLHVGDASPCVVGDEVVVGHRVMLHGCRVEDACLIGMQATILDDAVIGAGSVVGAAALVTQGMVIPPRSLVLGTPARVVRTLTESDEGFHRALAAKYTRLKENYLRDSLSSMTSMTSGSG